MRARTLPAVLVALQVLLSGAPSAAPRPDAVVFRGFPVDPALFRDDVASIADEIVGRHGLEEWRAAVIANELHRHLGIYSIIGVKMGIRARELLNATLDDLEVTSLASNEPPLSCLNDGLQASTGASLGRGSISIDPSGDPSGTMAGAIFMKEGKRLKITVKDSVIAGIREDIRSAVAEHGERRDAADAVARRQFRIGVGVDLREHDVIMLRRLGREHRPEGPAGAAPTRPEVDHHRPRAAGHVVEVSGVERHRRPGQQFLRAPAADGCLGHAVGSHAVSRRAVRACDQHADLGK